MSKTLLITMLALFATVTAEPYLSALSSFYGPMGPIAAAYSVPGSPYAPLAPAVYPGAPAAVAAPVSPYSSDLAPTYAFGGFGSLYDGRLSSAQYTIQPSYGYGYGYTTGADAFIYRR